MSKKINIVMIAILLFGSGGELLAQGLSNPQRRYINLQVYSLLESYARYGKLSSNYKTIDENYLREYTSLFDSSARIFNDILPYNRMDHKLPLDEYLDLAEQYYSSGIAFRLHNIQIGIPKESSANRYRIEVHVLKEIYGTTAQNANYKDTLSLTFNISFTFEDSGPEGFKIFDIEGSEVGRTLRLLIVDGKTNNPLSNVPVRFNSHTYYTNSSGRIEFKDLDPDIPYSYKIEDNKHATISQTDFFVDDIIESTVQSNPVAEYFDPNEIVERLSIPASRFFLSMHISPFAIGNGIQLDYLQTEEHSDTLALSYSWSPNYYFGFKTGYNLFSTIKSHVSLLLGLEYFHYSSMVTINNSSSQLVETSGFSFPLHLLVKYNLIDRLNLNIESGLNLNYLINTTYTNTDEPDSPPRPKEKDWSANNISSVYISPSISWDLSPHIEIYGGPSMIIGLNELSGNNNLNPLIIKKATLRVWSVEIGLRYRLSGKNDSSNNK